MKIMLVGRVHPWHRPGGMPFVTQDRAHALAQMGHEVAVFTSPFDVIPDGAVHRQAPHGAEWYCAPDGAAAVWWQVGVPAQQWSAPFAESCRRFAEHFQPDIIHSDSFDSHNPWLVEWTGRARTAITLHGFTAGGFLTETTKYRMGLRSDPPAFDSVGNLREAGVLAKVSRVITVSRHEQRLAEQYYGVFPTTVFNPIPEYFFAPLRPIPEHAYALCVGVPGTSGNRRFGLAEQVCRELNLPIMVVSGGVPRTDLPSIYDGCLCYLLPTLWHTGFDLAVAEANARGRLVIASHVGTYAELGDGVETFPVNDAERLKALVAQQMDRRRTATSWLRHSPEFHANAWLRAIES